MRRSISKMSFVRFFSIIPLLLMFPGLLATGCESSQRLRVATFNVCKLKSMKLEHADDSGRGKHPQLRKAAEIIQIVRPDILLIDEIDYDPSGRSARLFQERYLRVAWNGRQPIFYKNIFIAPVNAGVPSGVDLNNDGVIHGTGDAFSYGRYPGQSGMALYSRFAIDKSKVRTFQNLLWKDMPDNLMPNGRDGKPEFFSPEATSIFRLSTKSHWDVPVRVGSRTLHLLASHPASPTWYIPADCNARRNYDEIRLWADYLSGGDQSSYILDDQGRRGGLEPESLFVLLGALGNDPHIHPMTYGRPPIDLLLKHPRIQDPRPQGAGGVHDANDYPGVPACRTSEFGRLDYVLPARHLTIVDAGVFWPTKGDLDHEVISDPFRPSDQYLVWVDIALP